MPSGIYKRKPCSEETKRKIGLANSIAMKGKEPWNKGKKGVMPPPWNKGKKNCYSKNTLEKMSKIKKGKYADKESWEWKGNDVGYRGLHSWVTKHLGKAHRCELCKLNKIPKKFKRYFQWANISHKYKRNLKDWIQLCIKCHKKYDKTKC